MHLLKTRHSVTKQAQKAEFFYVVLIDPISGQNLDYAAAGSFGMPASLHLSPMCPHPRRSSVHAHASPADGAADHLHCGGDHQLNGVDAK